MVLDGFTVIAEKVDTIDARFQFNIRGPYVLVGLLLHVFPLVFGKKIANVGGATVGAAVVNPPDATAFRLGSRFEGYGDA